METLTIQAHVDGTWHDAAVVRFDRPERGISGSTRIIYDDDYVFGPGLEGLQVRVIDRRALSVRCPVSLEDQHLRHWPAWLLDLMPQGVARDRIARDLGLARNDPALDMQLLLRAGGAPIGNLRIREARELEAARLADVTCPPLTDADIETHSERFLDVVDRFAHLASGSSGVQGEWPKALLTRSARDHHWYPDPFVPTEEGIEHVIVKILKSSRESDRLILESEAPYLEVARAFGLQVGAALSYRNGVLVIPRFDREVTARGPLLHGQESLVSAKGIAEFGHLGSHEDYLAILREVSDDPVADTLDYVLRDLLNIAMGNPDNHGRNTALTRPAGGGVRLAPLFDFPPMRLSDAGISRSTRWACMRGEDPDGDWRLVCQAAAFDGLAADTIREALLGKLPVLRDLNRIAAEAGVPGAVIERALNPTRAIRALEKLETGHAA